VPSSPAPSARTRRVAVAIGGAIGAAAVLGAVVARHADEFTEALRDAPVSLLLAATALQLVALLARTEAWHVCVGAAGGTIERRRLYRAAGIGYLGSQLNSQLGAAARIAALRRTDPEAVPRIPAFVAAEVPILVCGLWSGLAVLRSLRGRNLTVALVLVAVFAQIGRNWFMLRTVGVDASVFDATAVLIAMVTLSQLPVGPSVGAGAAVLILGGDGVAAAAAAGVLLTATGVAGALCYVGWAAADHVWVHRRRAAPRAARALEGAGPSP
jgi:uncharacterized membrane protein YbhN (UPF0104 family)